MNSLLWVLQVLLALHTAIGAVWKFSHSPVQTMPSLGAIPNGAWIAMSLVELACAACLVLPAISKSLAVAAPVAALLIALEMLVFCALHLAAGNGDYGPLVYWLVVAAVCAFVAFGRLVLSPFAP